VAFFWVQLECAVYYVARLPKRNTFWGAVVYAYVGVADTRDEAQRKELPLGVVHTLKQLVAGVELCVCGGCCYKKCCCDDVFHD
jgi:hypothetical protein